MNKLVTVTLTEEEARAVASTLKMYDESLRDELYDEHMEALSEDELDELVKDLIRKFKLPMNVAAEKQALFDALEQAVNTGRILTAPATMAIGDVVFPDPVGRALLMAYGKFLRVRSQPEKSEEAAA